MQLPQILKKNKKIRSSSWVILAGLVGTVLAIMQTLPKELNNPYIFALIFVGGCFLFWINREKGGDNNNGST